MSTNLVTTIQMIDKCKNQMALALPKHMNSDRLARIALTELRQNPALQQCEPKSFIKCLMVSAQLGLEPGLLGHAYFVPYKKECTLIIGYKGMIDLARRSGQIASIEARVVCENDICDIRLGMDSGIDHTFDIRRDRGAPIGYYAIAKFIGGGKQFEFMSKHEIEAVRAKSPAGKSGPWVSYFDEMAKKTVIRRLFKYLPVSIEMSRALNLEEMADMGKQANAVDVDFFEVDEETGEILDGSTKADQADSLADKIK